MSTNPPVTQAVDQYIVAELTRANGIVDQLIRTSPDVICLIEQLNKNIKQKNINECEICVVQDDLREKFKTAMCQENIASEIVPRFALLHAYNVVRDIKMVHAKLGDSIVVYFLCKTVKALHELGQMIVSGFMHAVFAAAIESHLAHGLATVDVYVRADEFNLALLCLSSQQDKGKSCDRQ